MESVKHSVTLAYVHPGSVKTAFMESVLGVTRSTDVEVRLFSLRFGPLMSLARNTIVSDFLDDTRDSSADVEEWLWMVDTDISFEANTLRQLLEIADGKRCPILGGLYFTSQDDALMPVLYQSVGDLWEPMLEYPKNSLVEVAAVGSGCLLIHRSVLTTIGKDWFSMYVDDQGEFAGEDLAFCVRARSRGFPIHVHTGIKLGHTKDVVLDERLYDASRAFNQNDGHEARRPDPALAR